MFLGAHTVSDTQSLMDDIDHRFGKVDELYHRVMDPMPHGMAMTGKDADTVKANWTTLKKLWDDTKTSVGRKLILLRFTNPLPVNVTAVPASDYNQVLGFVELDSGDPNIHPLDSLRGIQLFLEAMSGITLDIDEGRPVPVGQTISDPDSQFLASPVIQAVAKPGEIIAKKVESVAGNPNDHTIRNVALGVGGLLALVLGIKILR